MNNYTIKSDIKQLSQSLLNSITEGAILIDKKGSIIASNVEAHKNIGYILSSDISHSSGNIAVGDIVIIADSKIGDDDGDLTIEDLSLIGVKDINIKRGDTLLAVGVYKDPKHKPEYKYFYSGDLSHAVSLETSLNGINILVKIDPLDSYSLINVNGIDFRMNFFRSIGNIVIIDPKTENVKFYQDKGYTIRHEGLGEILRGNTFSAKDATQKIADLFGTNIKDIFEEGPILNAVQSVLCGDSSPIYEQFIEINKRMMLCSIAPFIISNTVEGAVLKIEDASSLEELVYQRNQIISKIELLQQKHIDITGSPSEDPFPDFLGTSASIKRVKFLAKRAAGSKANILITGASGTGKSRLAREIHNVTGSKSPFIEVNCASIPSALFESELFGYVAGAFTGALKTGKRGYFEAADGGTLFLDEIGELPLEIQVKLLQALQTKRIYRVGSSEPTHVNVRIIAATNVDLKNAIINNKFRLDLYYKLNVLPIDIPPLSEHRNDILVIANKTLSTICKREQLPLKQLSAEAVQIIINYSWPGNVRELENIIERAVLLCDGNIIFPEYIDIQERYDLFNNSPTSIESIEFSGQTMKNIVDNAKKSALLTTLSYTNGDKIKAMHILKLTKSTFYEYLKKYNVD